MANLWNPFGEFARMREEMRNLFPHNSLVPMLGDAITRTPSPSVDIHETEKEVVVSAEIPGVDPSELNVIVDEAKITISGETKRSTERSEDGYRMMERRVGRFSRTIPLPVEVKPDEAWAEYKHGILEIRMNKAESGRTRARRLQIKDIH